jgi:hypothetical protein
VGGTWEVVEEEESLMTSWCAFLRFRTGASNPPSPKPKSELVFAELEFSLRFSFLLELDHLEAVADKAVREVEERLVGVEAAVGAKKVVFGGRPHDLRAGGRDAFCMRDVYFRRCRLVRAS